MINSKKLTEQMNILEKQRDEALKIEQYNDIAIQLRNLYNIYLKDGFTEKQARELTITIIANNL